MGWSNCGTDSEGRPIGYGHSATCDHAGCNAAIDRGLGYACGGEHGNGITRSDLESCEQYFCGEHLVHAVINDDGDIACVCFRCAARIAREEPEWQEL